MLQLYMEMIVSGTHSCVGENKTIRDNPVNLAGVWSKDFLN